ncbi:MAG: hypothetical protein ACPGSM_15955 [Thiolinea sp.]
MTHKTSLIIILFAFFVIGVVAGQEPPQIRRGDEARQWLQQVTPEQPQCVPPKTSAPPCQNPVSGTVHKYYRYEDAQGCEHGEVRAEEPNGAKCMLHGYCECGDSSS